MRAVPSLLVGVRVLRGGGRHPPERGGVPPKNSQCGGTPGLSGLMNSPTAPFSDRLLCLNR